jgi:hydroxyacylglutathione hydrolase
MVNKLEVTAVTAFADNYLWLVHAPAARRQVVAVDPGDADAITQALDRHQLQLAAVLVTHHHGDHVGGVRQLHEKFAVPVFGPASEIIPGEPAPLHEGDRVKLTELGLAFTVLDVPGHTAGHIAYVGHQATFCGDTLFSAGCGRLFEGTAEQMWNSLSKLAQLPSETQVFCAHEYTLDNLRFAQAVEPDNVAVTAHIQQCQAWRAEARPTVPSTIGLELNINPFLRVRHETVKRAAERQAGRTLDSEPEVFAALREWKNHFRG